MQGLESLIKKSYTLVTTDLLFLTQLRLNNTLDFVLFWNHTEILRGLLLACLQDHMEPGDNPG